MGPSSVVLQLVLLLKVLLWSTRLPRPARVEQAPVKHSGANRVQRLVKAPIILVRLGLRGPQSRCDGDTKADVARTDKNNAPIPNHSPRIIKSSRVQLLTTSTRRVAQFLVIQSLAASSHSLQQVKARQEAKSCSRNCVTARRRRASCVAHSSHCSCHRV